MSNPVTPETAPVKPKTPSSKVSASWQPNFRPGVFPEIPGVKFWPWTPRFVRVYRNKKTGEIRLDNQVYSLPDFPNSVKPGADCHIEDHEIMTVIDLVDVFR
jgi:hypothetical protein